MVKYGEVKVLTTDDRITTNLNNEYTIKSLYSAVPQNVRYKEVSAL